VGADVKRVKANRTRLSRQGSANLSKCQQMSASVSKRHHKRSFLLEKIFLVSNCQQMSADFFSSASVCKMMMTPAYPI
jgi:hypothetical protein